MSGALIGTYTYVYATVFESLPVNLSGLLTRRASPMSLGVSSRESTGRFNPPTNTVFN